MKSKDNNNIGKLDLREICNSLSDEGIAILIEVADELIKVQERGGNPDEVLRKFVEKGGK